jgi:ubiquinone/menaquinone biosynthesis C-methylase UbiE
MGFGISVTDGEVMAEQDIDRLRKEYARRRDSSADLQRYSLFNTAYLFAMQQRERALLRLLQDEQMQHLAGKRILEVGCGSGGVLLEYLGYGADPGGLTGVDLLEDRLVEGQKRLPGARFVCANAQRLPYPDKCYDLALQYTAFSSILDDQVKQEMAAEMLRVLKPDGMIIWYDFWLNPKNPQTRGIGIADIRQYFPNCRLRIKRITLAPPLARAVVPVSWLVGLLLEKLALFNTHYLVAIQRS